MLSGWTLDADIVNLGDDAGATRDLDTLDSRKPDKSGEVDQ